MEEEHYQLKAAPVRRRSAARLAAIQITYQALITGQSAAEFVPQFLLCAKFLGLHLGRRVLAEILAKICAAV